MNALGPAQSGPLAIALIDEATCIGCTLCIAACPVDAIIGAPKRMHTVLASVCTGCELCLPPCPVDCISMIPAHREWDAAASAAAQLQHDQRNVRLSRRERVNQRTAIVTSSITTREQREALAVAALARARARRART
ncbi:MAG: RnfABCDGE type electron transport complex subunit B [Betaproteobacteria bacterium]